MRFRKVVSLFDGMSCCQIALNRLGWNFQDYYAAEIDEFAKKVTSTNYPNTNHLGDITKWRSWNIDWREVDLITGGGSLVNLGLTLVTKKEIKMKGVSYFGICWI